MDNCLSAALDYVARGWSVIPIPPKAKQPTIKWAKYQGERATADQIRKWFATPKNLAVVCGEVSGGLVVRDFDDRVSYRRWASDHRDLAVQLPTVATSRGFHVYARMSPCPRVRDLGDGELRGNGGYVVAAPSYHPSGSVYRWVVPLEANAVLPVVSFADWDLLDDTETAESSETAKPVEPTEPTEPTDANGANGSHSWGLISSAINSCVPTRAGQRERKLFELARRIIGIAGHELSPDELIPIFDEWWILAEPVVETKDYAVGLSAFIRSYGNAKTAYGETMRKMLKKAMQSTQPKWVPPKSGPKTFALASLCRELQRENGEQPFFISCHTAGELLEVPPMTVWRWLDLFQRLRKIEIVEKGKRGTMKATRYRYIADDLFA